MWQIFLECSLKCQALCWSCGAFLQHPLREALLSAITSRASLVQLVCFYVLYWIVQFIIFSLWPCLPESFNVISKEWLGPHAIHFYITLTHGFVLSFLSLYSVFFTCLAFFLFCLLNMYVYIIKGTSNIYFRTTLRFNKKDKKTSFFLIEKKKLFIVMSINCNIADTVVYSLFVLC